MIAAQLAQSRGARAQLAWDTIDLKATKGIPSWLLHPMDAEFIEQFTGQAPGAYRADPDGLYCRFQDQAGTCYLDQYLAGNVLSMGPDGFGQDVPRSATQGAAVITVDGLVIDSPEAVVEHLERFVLPGLRQAIRDFPAAPSPFEQALADEARTQRLLGPDILKGPYDGFFCFPTLRYVQYGYSNYFMAYALYPEVIERDFALAAELAVLRNGRAAQAIIAGGLPPLLRLDHDMADARGTLVDIRSLDRLWLPHFARAIAPLREAGIRLIWHCDGNLMALVPRLLEVGIGGFQGFQYEDGMDYPRIAALKTRDGDDLLLIAGVSVTRTLPFGTREDVIRELRFLVEQGPRRGLMLGASSSITPNTNRDNIRTLIEGLRHYREHGRG